MIEYEAHIDTYTVYDQYGHVSCVIPPAAADQMTMSGSYAETSSPLADECYLYHYDKHGRCIYKKQPGCEPVYIIYDQADHPILTQDGNQRTIGIWTFNIPNAFGETVLTGTCKNSLSYTADPLAATTVLAAWDGSNDQLKGYVVSGMTLISPVIRRAYFYDDYRFLGHGNIPNDATTQYAAKNGYGQRSSKSCKGLMTGDWASYLGTEPYNEPSGNYLITYYDDRDRPVMMCKEGVKGYGITHMAYNFEGSPTKEYHLWSVFEKAPVSEELVHTYDQANRLVETTLSLNGQTPVSILHHEYDDVGRLIKTIRNGNNNLSTNYTYNLRSWPTDIVNPLFSEKIFYQEPHGNSIPRYNGNISAMDWKVNASFEWGVQRGYRFTYDGIDRLTSAQYIENGVSSNHYSTHYSYDLQGNLTSLTRNGLLDDGIYGVIDDLQYVYNGNRLIKVDDSVDGPYYNNAMHFVDGSDSDVEYTYDGNGNQTSDLNKKIYKIAYNWLNLPCDVTYTDGSSVSYSYDARGTKWDVDYVINTIPTMVPQVSGSSVSQSMERYWTTYFGDFVSVNDSVKQVQFDGGYASFVYNGSPTPTPAYHYFLKDHQGNNRVVMDDSGKIEQVNHYYPFGGLMGDSNNRMSNEDYPNYYSKLSTQPYKYNGKELDRVHGLDWYDYGARHYDPSLARWMCMDPKAEKYYSISPYAYCGNNPMNLIDPDGKADFEVNGKVIGNDGVDDDRLLILKTTESDFNGVAGAGLSKKEFNTTVEFIKANSGNTDAFQKNGLAYTNSIAIESSADNRQSMVNIISADNGKGGKSDDNNKEYGGSIKSGTVVAAPAGTVANPKTNTTANIELPSQVSTFHSHPSGEIVDLPSANTYGGTIYTYSFTQTPSPMDINVAGSGTHYVFGRSNGNVYVYTSSGVQAVIPMKYFVNPKR